jgi:plastocyanin
MNLSFFALRRSATLALSLLVAFVLVACSADDGGSSSQAPAASEGAGNGGSGTATVSDGAVDVAAADMAFDVTTIEATAGEAFTVTFTNNDSVPHNIAFYTEEGGDVIVQGEVINGGETVEVEVPAQDAGQYYFHCDVHPEMNGTLSVS